MDQCVLYTVACTDIGMHAVLDSVCIILYGWIEAEYVCWCQVKLWSLLHGKILIVYWTCKAVWILKEFWSIHTLSQVWPACKALAISRTAGVLFSHYPHLIPSTCGRFKLGSLQVPVLWLPPSYSHTQCTCKPWVIILKFTITFDKQYYWWTH